VDDIFLCRNKMRRIYNKAEHIKNTRNNSMPKTKRFVKKSKNFTLKKQVCSPIVNGKTQIEGSCFTPAALEQLKIHYNKNHPNNPIKESRPQELWNEFRKRLFSCRKEDCWLKEIDDKEMRENLEKFLFAPSQPKEWKKNPKEWLSNFDIIEVLHQYELTHPSFKVIGPTPIDFDSRPTDQDEKCVWEELCNFDIKRYYDSGKTKLGIVFNLDKHDEPGSHWVSLFVDLEDKFIFYLDSAGNKIPREIRKLVKRIKKQGLSHIPLLDFKFYENYPLEHQMGNTECGVYSLYFIITMLTGETEHKSLTNKTEKIRFFKEKRIPDKYVSKYRKIYFNN